MNSVTSKVRIVLRHPGIGELFSNYDKQFTKSINRIYPVRQQIWLELDSNT
jgi:hypothetical protein